MSMVDITSKEPCYREAVAVGRIKLRPQTVQIVRERKAEKGDALEIAKVAASLAVKKTPEIVPLCHPIKITGVETEYSFGEDWIEVCVKVKAFERTGVEMEALVGVCAALLALWDIVKKYEKDESGQYPWTSIEGVRVLRKVKSAK